jgi:nucleoside phosphorylase
VNNTLICFALEAEAKPFRLAFLPRSDVRIVVTGMGKDNSRKAILEALARHQPSRALTCGLAGALTESLALNEIVFDADADFPLALKLKNDGALPVRFFCSPAIVSRASDKARLWKSTGAQAVDMESEVIRDACRTHGVPSATVRVVSDLANETLPLDFNRFLNADMSMNFLKIALAVATNPSALPKLLRFQKQTNVAAAKLGLFLADLLRSIAVDDSQGR